MGVVLIPSVFPQMMASSFFFLINTSVVNMWIIHKEILRGKGHEKESLSHFKFIVALCKVLTRTWASQKATISLLYMGGHAPNSLPSKKYVEASLRRVQKEDK